MDRSCPHTHEFLHFYDAATLVCDWIVQKELTPYAATQRGYGLIYAEDGTACDLYIRSLRTLLVEAGHDGVDLTTPDDAADTAETDGES